MRTDLPTSIVDTLVDLETEPLVQLFRIELIDNTVIHVNPYQDLTWQGDTYTGVPCKMSDLAMEASGRLNRPKFTFANPEGLFTQHLYAGGMDAALITRIRVLKSDLLANNDFSVEEQFRVSRIVSIADPLVVLELRDVLDGHTFMLPADSYIPPEYPHVRLS